MVTLKCCCCRPVPGLFHKEGHAEKHVGKRLLNFKSSNKELVLEDYYVNKKEKKLKKFAFYLPYKYINQLQNYYGIAIRSNANTSVSDMRKAVDNLQSLHKFRPLSSTSWCKYVVDQVNGPNKYVEKPGLSIPLRIKLRNCSKGVCMETHGTVMNP